MLLCNKCGKKYSMNESVWQCECSGLLDIDFKAILNFNEIKRRPPTMWRYREAIPIENDINIVSFNEGFTPIVDYSTSSGNVLLKLDYFFPTGSYKDRGASVLISKANEIGVKKVIEDSSGNAGCAIAAYCAKAKIECEIYVPQDTSIAKLTQVKAYGAKLNIVNGNRLQTAQKALQDAKNTYYASHTYNPFFFQGTKTLAFEVFEQLNDSIPDYIFIPTGNGTMFIGVYLGFMDLAQNGYIDNLPKLIAIQSENCAPIFKQYKENLKAPQKVEEKYTLAEGIAINEPIRSNQIIDIIKKTNGDVITVNEQEIKDALIRLSLDGFYIEPTSASALAGFLKYKPCGKSLVVLTGFGLKSNDKIQKIISEFM
ncbi:MAG: threonine synthase [Desulfurella sp.]|uniref:threonine synthase n=1 Tax=Desulfurella sp. TaxID=1962857 RepID=UPI000CB5DA08|nr:threonine synthase [Desulfurella sp.]PMP89117.1 MAG: threonine synthase [Desulfurella sp.]